MKWADIANSDPSKFSDQQLEEALLHCWTQASGNFDLGGATTYLIAAKTARNTRKTIRWSFITSLVALAFASLSLCFSMIDWRGDKDWQKQQIRILSEIRDSLSGPERSELKKQ